MTKLLSASCVGGVVTADGLPLAGATILSEGVGSSSGIALIDEDAVTYLAKATGDLKTTLEQVLDALGAVKAALQAISTGPVTAAGGAAGPTFPALAADLVTRVTAITAVETQLTTLKGALR